MSKKQLTEEQLNALEPLERFFGTAIRSGYCSYPGEANIELMRRTWTELTGQEYPFRRGCPHCIFNLITDLGNLYFAVRPERNVDPNQKTRYFGEKPPQEPVSQAKPTKTPAKKKTAAKRK